MKFIYLIIFFSSCFFKDYKTMDNTSGDILKKIESDICEKGYFYFLPDNPNSEYIGSRCHVFWDENSWLICFETITYGIGGEAIMSELVWFDNISTNSSSDYLNSIYHPLSEIQNLKSLFGIQLREGLKNDSNVLEINDSKIKIDDIDSIGFTLKKKDPNYKFEKISPSVLMRYLIDKVPESIFLKEEQLKNLLNIKMNKQFTVNSWMHNDIVCLDNQSSNISQNKFINEIANLISKKSNDYKGESNSNTHWINYMYGL